MTIRSLPGIAAVAAAIGDALTGSRGGFAKQLDMNTLAAVMGYTPNYTGAVQDTLQNGMSDIVSLKRFGVKADGVTDDTTAMLKARDSGAGLLLFTPGTIVCDQLDWNVETHLWGFGSNLCKLKSVTTTASLIVHPSSAGSRTTIKGFTIDGASASQPVGNWPGILLQRKLYAEDIICQGFKNDGLYMAPYDANIATAAAGTIGNAAFFCHLNNCIFTNNGRDGMWSRMGFNANKFDNCQYTKNTRYGMHQSTDGGSTYGNYHSSGQASYNGSYGYFFESGTNTNTRSLYSEYNGSTDGTNTNGYVNTPYDIYIGDNCLNSWFDVGTLFGSSSAIKDSHIRLPGFNPDRIQVWEGGRHLYGN